MRFHYSATALALITTSALAQECPTGYEKTKGLAWTNCPTEKNDKLQCASIEVPKDWKDPASVKMKLRLVRYPAQSESPRGRSVIINPGGPGASGIEAVIDGGWMYQSIIGDDFHIIGFDPRGVGLTLPYTCTDEDEGTKVTRAVRELEDQEGYYNSYVALANKCNQKEVDGKLIGTAYVARDVKAIAESLGEDGLIRYMGYSYGTLLGATLSAMFPSQIDRIVLDGNVSPQSYYHKLGTESSTDTDAAFRRFFDLCAKAGKDKAGKANCAWAVQGQNGDQLTQKFDAFLDRLTAGQSNVVRDKFFMILYRPSGFKGFAEKLQGWYNAPSSIPESGTTEKDDKKKKRQESFKPDTYKTVKTTNAISGISCSDRITRLKGSADDFKQWLTDYRKVTKYGYDLASAGDLRCSVWPTIANEQFDVPQSGIDTKNYILFVNTPYDPVTPMVSAENSAKSFTKSGLLKSSGVGHCSTSNWSKKLNEAVKSYMITGNIPEVKDYEPDTENVFDEEPEEPAVNAGVHSKRGYEYPSYFSKREEAEQIPAGCTRIPVSSSAVVSLSSSIAPSVEPSQSVSMSVSASQSSGPTPSVSASASASASESFVLLHSESVSASALPSVSIPVPESHEPTPAASDSASASASVLAQQSSSVHVQASVTPSVSASESHTVAPSAPVSESMSVSIAHVDSSSIQQSQATQTPLASVAGEQGSPSSSIHTSVPVSVSDLASASSQAAIVSASSSAVEHLSSSYAAETSFPSASASISHASTSSHAVDPASASVSASASTSASIDYAANAASASASASASIEHISPSSSAEHGSASASTIDHLSLSHALESTSASVPASSSYILPSSSVVLGSVSSSAAEHLSLSYAIEIPTPSASITSLNDAYISSSAVYSVDPATITISASYSLASSIKYTSSSSLYHSSDVPVSHSESSYNPSVPSSSVHVDDSSSAYADASSSAHFFSASVSDSHTVPEPSSSAAYSDSSIFHPSTAPSAIYPDISAQPSAYSIATYSQSSPYPSGSFSSIKYSGSSIVHPSASSSIVYYLSSTPVYAPGGSTSGSENPKSKGPVSDSNSVPTAYATSIPVHSYSEQPKSAELKYLWSSNVHSYPSSVPSYPQDPKINKYNYSASKSIPARSSSVPSYPEYPVSSIPAYAENGEYPTDDDYPTYPASTYGKPTGPKVTSAPCPTVAWSSQPGYLPVTKTYTTTNVRTITKCPETVKDCPLNSSIKTYLTTEIKTRTTVVATPSLPPSGDKPYISGKESDKKSSSLPSKETGKVSSSPNDTGYPSQPSIDTGKIPQPPKETKPVSSSQPIKNTGYPVPPKSTDNSYPSQSKAASPSQPAKETDYTPQPPKETKPIQSSHSAYAPPKISSGNQPSSQPAVPTNNIPPYPTGPAQSNTVPSIKVCNGVGCSYVPGPTGTKPIIPVGSASSTSKSSSTLRTATPGVTMCFGKDCKTAGTPTGYTPAQFTGAAASGRFVSSIVSAGALLIALARVF